MPFGAIGKCACCGATVSQAHIIADCTHQTLLDISRQHARSTPQWNYTPEGVLASSPQVGLGGAGLGLRSSELYLKCMCSKKSKALRAALCASSRAAGE